MGFVNAPTMLAAGAAGRTAPTAPAPVISPTLIFGRTPADFSTAWARASPTADVADMARVLRVAKPAMTGGTVRRAPAVIFACVSGGTCEYKYDISSDGKTDGSSYGRAAISPCPSRRRSSPKPGG